MKQILAIFALACVQTLSAQSILTTTQQQKYAGVAKYFLQKILTANRYDTAYRGLISQSDGMASATMTDSGTTYDVYIHYEMSGNDTVITRFVMSTTSSDGHALSAAVDRMVIKKNELVYRTTAHSVNPNAWQIIPIEDAVPKIEAMIQKIKEKVLYF